MLPPNPKFGTTADMQAMVAKAQQAGHLFMPYSNPTWWDVKSRTVLSWLQQGFPLTSFSALNSSMQPYFKSYDAGPGVVVEPNNARVQVGGTGGYGANIHGADISGVDIHASDDNSS
eukprot:TRINITY_DN11074_c1_g1_i10.p3 TRINITY_DN11074_c1_g1~~TRINITY_DN11074_c1_g1_i10.p3  ORF type:complete len:117 (+),score=27.71 TRINITY_DN11074_c1_g1_i10:1240-1590(+)